MLAPVHPTEKVNVDMTKFHLNEGLNQRLLAKNPNTLSVFTESPPHSKAIDIIAQTKKLLVNLNEVVKNISINS